MKKQQDEKAGREQHEPGKPTRATPPEADPESVKIAKQQGTSQRGFTEDDGANPTPSSPLSGPPGGR